MNKQVWYNTLTSKPDRFRIIAEILSQSDQAKQILRDKGYGWTGLSLLETVKQEVKESETSINSKALLFLKKLIENGSFFISAIELDPHDCSIDGEEFKKEIEQLLKDANIEYDPQ